MGKISQQYSPQIPLPELPHDIINNIITINAHSNPSLKDVLSMLKVNKESAHEMLNSGSIDAYKHIPNAILELSKDDNNLALLNIIYEYPNLVDWKSANQPSKYIMTQDEFAKLSTDILDPLKNSRMIYKKPKHSEIQFYNFMGKNMKNIDDFVSVQNMAIIYSNYFKSLLSTGMFKSAEEILMMDSNIIENDTRLSAMIFACNHNLRSLFTEIVDSRPKIRNFKTAKLFSYQIESLVKFDNSFYVDGILKTMRNSNLDIAKLEFPLKDVLSMLKVNKESAHAMLNSGSIYVYKHIPNAILELSKDDNNLALLNIIYEYPNLVDWKSTNQPSKYIMTQNEFAKLSTDILNPLKYSRMIYKKPKYSNMLFYNFIRRNMKIINDNLSNQNKGLIYSNYFKSLLSSGMVKSAEKIFVMNSNIIENDTRVSAMIFACNHNLRSLFTEIVDSRPKIRNFRTAEFFSYQNKSLVKLDDSFYLDGILQAMGSDINFSNEFKIEKRMKYAIQKDKLNSFKILAKHYDPEIDKGYLRMLIDILIMDDLRFLHEFLYYKGEKIPAEHVNTIFNLLKFYSGTHIKFANEFIKNKYTRIKIFTPNFVKYFKAMMAYSQDFPDHEYIFTNRYAMEKIPVGTIEKAILKVKSKDKIQRVLMHSAVRDRLNQEILFKLREKFSI